MLSVIGTPPHHYPQSILISADQNLEMMITIAISMIDRHLD